MVAAEVDWTFGGTWPYEPRWLTTPDGILLHYVDEGPRDGQPVVMLHGNPTWSYLYRTLVGPLAAAGFRALAYDQMGFGRSDKPADPAACDSWRRRFPHAEVHELEAGHFVQGDAPEQLVPLVLDFLERT